MGNRDGLEPGKRNTGYSATKPVLTVDQQIEHLRRKGVRFEVCGEDEAREYLSSKSYFFRVASYRKLYPRHEGGDHDGEYVDLDFAQLMLLASLDQQLREALLPMALDVEHFEKVILLRKLAERGDEDGYAVLSDFLVEKRAEGQLQFGRDIAMRRNDVYSGGLIRKYEGDMPLWAYLEVVSFGCFIPVVKYCADRWGDEELAWHHYQLKYVKSVRNACAHQHAIINDLSDPCPGRGVRVSYALTRELAEMGVPKRTRAKRLANVRMQQIATLMSVYSKVVPAGRSRDRTLVLLSALFGRIDENRRLLSLDGKPGASMEFLRRLTEGYGLG